MGNILTSNGESSLPPWLQALIERIETLEMQVHRLQAVVSVFLKYNKDLKREHIDEIYKGFYDIKEKT